MRLIMKKVISVFLCAVLLFTLSITAFAADEKPFSDSYFFTSGDYTIHYRLSEHKGNFKGRIVMLHGFGQSSFSWQNMAAQMSGKGYDCYAVDLPNFGYSTTETAEITHIDREALVEQLMLSIAPAEEWTVAGHSMGGGVAINIAEDLNVKALFLVCPAPTTALPEFAGKIVTSKPLGLMMNFVLEKLTKIDFLMRIVVFAATQNKEYTKNYDLSGVTAPLQQKGTGMGLCYMLKDVRVTELDKTDKITCPVLIFNAEKDMVLRGGMKEQVLDAFPNAELCEVKGAGHICHEDRAEEMAEITYNFLNK